MYLTLPDRDELAQDREGLLDWRVIVPAVRLVQVHVVHPEPAERLVEPVVKVLAGEALPVGTLAHRVVDLGGYDRVLAAPLEELSEDLLRSSLGIDVGGVVERYPQVPGAPQHSLRAFPVHHPGRLVPEGHATQADARDLEPCLSESSVLHGRSRRGSGYQLFRCRSGGLALGAVQRDRVHAVPESGRLRTVAEDVPEVGSTLGALDLGPLHEEGVV